MKEAQPGSARAAREHACSCRGSRRRPTAPSLALRKGERAGRTAYASLKHSFEKVGDHWEAKDHKGRSDPRSKQSTRDKRAGKGETFGGVDEEGHTRQELYERAKAMNVLNRSKMDKMELARALAKKQK